MHRLTVVVPSHNEEGSIQDCVDSLLASARGSARILVVAHNCTDSTGDKAKSSGAEVLVFNDIGAKGKGHALRQGFSRALEGGADAVLVVDADSVVSPNLIPSVLERLGQGASAIQCRYEMLSADQSLRSRLTSLAFRAFTYIRPAGRGRIGLSAGISGNGFALTSKLLSKVPYDAFSVVEDLEYHLQMLMAGESVSFIEDAVVYSYLPVSRSGEDSQQSRWQGGRLWLARKYLPSLIMRVAVGRFRMIEPTLDLAGLPLAFGVAALLAEAFIPLHLVHVYVIIALLIIAAHVVTAACAGPKPLRELQLLVVTPFYILWKITLVPKLLKGSNKRATWIRTDRAEPITSQLRQRST